MTRRSTIKLDQDIPPFHKSGDELHLPRHVADRLVARGAATVGKEAPIAEEAAKLKKSG